jgi:hypothetical protein
MKMIRNFALLFGALLSVVHADNDEDAILSPWFTGSLIAPQEVALPIGHFEVETYIYATVNTGSYKSNWSTKDTPNYTSIQPQLFFIVGTTPWMDIEIVPQAFYNFSQGQSSFEFGDLAVVADFQLISPDKWKHFPGVKFAVRETFPTGAYQNLHPNKKGTDIGGQGSYQTSLNLLFYKIVHLNKQHYLTTTLSFTYSFFTSLHVNGFNAYGGGFGTHGTIKPGDNFQGIFSFEYSFTRNWAFAMDTVYTHTNRNRFSGEKGFTQPGPPIQGISLPDDEAAVGNPSSDQFSFAPAIEYNFSSHFGIIAGAWFSAFGRNSSVFRSGVINFLYVY